MPIVIRIEHAICIPYVVCDHCDEDIVEAWQGNYEYVVHPPDEDACVHFIHKRCSLAHERKLEELLGHRVTMGTNELEVLLVFLARNLGVKWKDAVEHADLMGKI